MGCRYASDANTLLQLNFEKDHCISALQYMIGLLKNEIQPPENLACKPFNTILTNLKDVGLDVKNCSNFPIGRFLNR